MKLWTIDDGAQHTIAAATEAEAYGVYAESLINSGSDWPDEKPTIEPMEPTKVYTLHLDGSGKKLELQAREWATLFGKPEYVGCSDW